MWSGNHCKKPLKIEPAVVQKALRRVFSVTLQKDSPGPMMGPGCVEKIRKEDYKMFLVATMSTPVPATLDRSTSPM